MNCFKDRRPSNVIVIKRLTSLKALDIAAASAPSTGGEPPMSLTKFVAVEMISCRPALICCVRR